MEPIRWERDRILSTPSNLYMEYILLSFNNYLKQKLKNMPITYGELTYIYNIKQVESASQKELAELLHVTEANITKMLKKLEKKGFVRREPDEKNKSRKIISLSEEGEEICSKIEHVTVEWENDFLKNIPEDKLIIFKEMLYEIALACTRTGI